MTILVTGGAGYIGSQTVLALLDAGLRPVVLDNLSTGHEAAVPTGVTFHVGDVGDEALIGSIIREHRIEAVLHFAGSVIVEDSMRDPATYYENNTFRTLALVGALHRHNVRKLVFSSTAAVYGETTLGMASEDAPLVPISPYGRSKLFAEQMIADFTASHPDFEAVVLRYFNVAGADPKGRAGQRVVRATHLIGAAVEAALGERASLDIFGTDYPTRDGTCERDYIHVLDLAEAHLVALRYLAAGGKSVTLNCGYGRGITVREVIDAVQNCAGRQIETFEQGRRLGDPPSLVAASGRIRDTLGWRPRLDDLDGIVASSLRWRAALLRSEP